MAKKLPVVGSSAGKIDFATERVPIGVDHLWLDGNAKITRDDGTFEAPVANAFSLRQVIDCPQSTPTCRASCYVHNLEKAQPDVHALYTHNAQTVRSVLGAGPTYAIWAAWKLGDHVNRNLASFRWHVSGDVFSEAYARWIVKVCSFSPRTEHWIYTRSLAFVPELVEAKNLVVNLSADRDNLLEVRTVAHEYGLRICYFSPSPEAPPLLPADSVLFPDYTIRSGTPDGARWFASMSSDTRKTVCPSDYFGKSNANRCGPCKKCLRPVGAIS